MDTVSSTSKNPKTTLNTVEREVRPGLYRKTSKRPKFNKIFSKKKRNVYSQDNKVFVGGLKNSISNSLLLSYFSKFGTVLQIDVVKSDSTSRRRGFCFIVYENAQEAKEVISQKSHMVGENLLEVKESYAQKRNLGKEETSFLQRISTFLKNNEGKYAELREDYFSYKLMIPFKSRYFTEILIILA